MKILNARRIDFPPNHQIIVTIMRLAASNQSVANTRPTFPILVVTDPYLENTPPANASLNKSI